MPRVLIVNQFANPPTRSGGTRHHALARGLLEYGFETTIVASSVGNLAGDESHQSGEGIRDQIEGVDYLFLPQPRLRRSLSHRLYTMLRFSANVWIGRFFNQMPRPHVVVGSSPSLFAAYAAARYARRLRIPFVLEIRDLWPLSIIEVAGVSPNHVMVKIMERLEKWLYMNSDHIVTLLPGAPEYLVGRGADERRITVLPNGVDLSVWPESRSPSIGDGPLKIMYAGAHGPANALDVIVDAAVILYHRAPEDFHFYLVGDGSDKSRLIGRVEKDGIRNVTFENPVSKKFMADKLSTADVFVINIPSRPLYRYGFSPNKLFDYMASSRPIVIGTDVSSNPVAECGGGFVIPPDRAECLVDALIQLKEMALAERVEMGHRSRQCVEQNFDMAKLSLTLGKVLKGVL